MNTPVKFQWSLVTGRDFARGIAWAKTQPRLRELAMAVVAKKKIP